jgi:aspartyl-tRNA(Asn)/glutamyl-tRNA(Gln) amidotransferase subunit B
MNRGDFLAENAAALAQIVQANVTREALDDAFARAATERIEAAPYLAQTAVGDESELAPVIEAVLAANPDQVATYRDGKEGVLGFFVGAVMRETQGRADPKVVNRLLREKLQA